MRSHRDGLQMRATMTQPQLPNANTHTVFKNKKKPGDVLVNGKIETAATSNISHNRLTKTVTTVTVDDQKIEEKLKQEGMGSVVTIPFANGTDVAIGELNGQTVKNMEMMDAVLEIQTGNATYSIPASEINIDAVSE